MTAIDAKPIALGVNHPLDEHESKIDCAASLRTTCDGRCKLIDDEGLRTYHVECVNSSSSIIQQVAAEVDVGSFYKTSQADFIDSIEHMR